jgi:hypothetical protein
MGSPRNYLGSGGKIGAPGSLAHEPTWLSVSGYCASSQHGDRISSRSDNNGLSSEPFSCMPGTPSYVKANPDYSADGYFYTVDFAVGSVGAYKFDVYDAPNCQFEASSPIDTGAAVRAAARQYDFVVRSNDNNDPNLATMLYTRRLSPSDCASWSAMQGWKTLYTFNNPSPGRYYLQVRPVVPTNKYSEEGENHFGIRVAQPSGFSPCTNDQTTAGTGLPFNAMCPKVYALTNLGVYAALSGTGSSYMASIGANHAGKTMEVEIFDPDKGAAAVELIDPAGTPVTFRWEVACKDGTYQSDTGKPCSTGEAAPGGGYGNTFSNKLDVSGASTQPWTHLSQTGKYNDRVVRLKVVLPTNYATKYGSGPAARTWWKLRYTMSAPLADGTTWTVRIKG